MTAAQRAVENTAWREVTPNPDRDGKIPHVTHEGTITLAGYDLRVYQLSDGVRVFDSDDIQRAFGQQIRRAMQ